jgi:hypothetical protein
MEVIDQFSRLVIPILKAGYSCAQGWVFLCSRLGIPKLLDVSLKLSGNASRRSLINRPNFPD